MLALQFKLKTDNDTERTLVERHKYGRDEALDYSGIATFSAKTTHYSQLVNIAT